MPTPVSHAYPELMHYTTYTGLHGIVTSGCLWATDASHLNDASEITHFFESRLKDVIANTVRKRGIELARSPDILAKIITRGGFDSVIEDETNATIMALREATISMNRPFVLSLCGASDLRVSHSGLLSQWRGYGSDGGFAIVFDTAALESALRSEAERYHYMHVQMGDVYYEGIDPTVQPAAPDFAEAEEIVRTGVERLLRGGTAEETDGFYQAVTGLSCLCKHWGFWEEREVRVVVVPSSQEVLDADPDSSRITKPIRHFTRGTAQIPYIELFSPKYPPAANPLLPIKRVIVGPHRDACDRTKRAEALLRENGYRAIVEKSKIPYLGR
jgi:hypothetical protein